MPDSLEKKRQRSRDFYYANRGQEMAQAREYRRLIKGAVIEHYGGECACCSEDNIAFLCIDHINCDGAKHRREIGQTGGIGFYSWLKQNNFPSGFRVLCFNCNVASYRNGGICPHQIEQNLNLN
jgi:hypothetical protein